MINAYTLTLPLPLLNRAVTWCATDEPSTVALMKLSEIIDIPAQQLHSTPEGLAEVRTTLVQLRVLSFAACPVQSPEGYFLISEYLRAWSNGDQATVQIEINSDWLAVNDGVLPPLGLRMISLLPIYFLTQFDTIGLFHGGLLSRDSHVCLVGGPSGMGKSTICRELADSWTVWADDMVLCSFRDGICGAQPLPTWSIWVSHSAPPRSFRSDRLLEINKVILLGRGGPNWRRLARQEFKLAMAESFGTFVFFGSKMFQSPLSTRQLWANISPLLDGYCDWLPGFLFQRSLNDSADALLTEYLKKS